MLLSLALQNPRRWILPANLLFLSHIVTTVIKNIK